MENEASAFAATAFSKVFFDYDEEFLQSNLKDDERAMSAYEFIQQLRNQLGVPLKTEELERSFTTRLVSRQLAVEGRFQVLTTYRIHGSVWLNIQVSRIGDGWQIDHVGRNFAPHKM